MAKKKIEQPKRPEGRPTKYKEEYCETIIDFFNIDHTREIEREVTHKDGSTSTRIITVANRLPTFERFAVDCGVHTDTLQEWKVKYESFSVACKRCKNMQKDMINNLGMMGLYNAAYTMFVAKNITDMRDTQHIEQESTVKNTIVVTETELADAKKQLKEELSD